MLPWNFSVAFSRALALHIIFVIFIFFRPLFSWACLMWTQPSYWVGGLKGTPPITGHSEFSLTTNSHCWFSSLSACSYFKEFSKHFTHIQTKECFPSPTTHHLGFLTNHISYGLFWLDTKQAQMPSITQILKQTMVSDKACEVLGTHEQYHSKLSKFLQSWWR